MNQEVFVNVASHLPKMAQQQPDATAILIPVPTGRRKETQYKRYTFAELDQQSNRMARALISVGIERGVRTVLMVPPSFEFFALTFALFKVAAVPVLIDPGMGIKNLKTCLAEAQPQAFIGVPKAHLARVLLRWCRTTVKTLLTIGPNFFWGGTTLHKSLAQIPEVVAYETEDVNPDDTAAVLFTSGSTGVPKGAVYSHGNFSAQVTVLREIYNILPGEIDLPTFPLFALFAPALGMTSVIPEMDFTRPAKVDPVKIINAIETFQVTTMFGSPALIDRVGRYGINHNVKLKSLQRAISAGAPVASPVLKRFADMLPKGAQVFTPYGATEALPVCSIGSDEILHETRHVTDQGGGVCIGHPVPSIRLEIIRITEDPIKEWDENLTVVQGEIGEIIVKGPQVTRSYFNRERSTVLSKIKDLDQGGFFHRMGDLGYRDHQGRIWFCGRKSHRVVTRNETLFTIPCEAIFNCHPDVFRSALVGIGRPGEQSPVLCVELEQHRDGGEELEGIRMELLAIAKKHAITRNIDTVLFHPAFPVDIRHNAKIFREKLALWATEKLS